MTTIDKARILIIATNGFEQSELEKSHDGLLAAGAHVDVASPDGNVIRGWDKKDWGRTVEVDKKIAECDCSEYDALVLPGGVMNPDKLRIDDEAMRVVREFLASGKIVAAICHGPWLLVEADACKGRKMTSYQSIRKDMENAGADWVDQDVVTDRGIITSRNPGDLDAFIKKIVEEVREGTHQRREAAE